MDLWQNQGKLEACVIFLVCDRLEEENVVVSFLGTSAKLQKVTINFVMPVHLFVCLHETT